MVNELVPHSAEFDLHLDTALDEDDMKSVGLWHPQTLLERYKSETKFDYRTKEDIANGVPAPDAEPTEADILALMEEEEKHSALRAKMNQLNKERREKYMDE